MPKCDVNKVALRLYWNHTSALVVSCKFSARFAANAARVLKYVWPFYDIAKTYG